MTRTSALAHAGAAGLLYGLALQPGAPAALAGLGLVPLLLVWTRVAPRRAALCGAAWAVTATVALATWFPGMLERFFGLPTAAGVAALAALALAVSAPPYAALGAWVAWRARRGPLTPVAVGAGWALAELVRAYGPVPNPYALLGTSQVATPLGQAADAVGAFGVSGLAACGSALVAALAAPALRGARPRRDLAVAAALVAAGVAYGMARLHTGFGGGPSVRVAVVQPGLEPRQRADAAHESARLDRQLALTAAARAFHPDVVFWPESSVDFYLREEGSERERLLASAEAIEADLVLGAPHYRYAEPEPYYYTSVFLVRDGAVAARYDKMRLVPFAESKPFGPWLAAEAARYTPGPAARALPAAGAAVGAFLCAEVLFPEVARAMANAGATILANPSNDGWFGAAAPAAHQLAAARLRAIENRRPLVRATTTGYSAVIDAHGRVLARSELGVPALLEASVRPGGARTLYQRGGDGVVALAALLVVLRSSLRPLPVPLSGGEPS